MDCASTLNVSQRKLWVVIANFFIRLFSVFITHHHWDHSGGNIELVGMNWWHFNFLETLLQFACSSICSTLAAKKPGLAVYGADARIPEINYVCKDQEEFKLGNLQVTPLHTPCHTKGHVCYSVVDPATGEKAVFTGEYVPCMVSLTANPRLSWLTFFCPTVALYLLQVLAVSLRAMHGTCTEFFSILYQSCQTTLGYIAVMNTPRPTSNLLSRSIQTMKR